MNLQQKAWNAYKKRAGIKSGSVEAIDDEIAFVTGWHAAMKELHSGHKNIIMFGKQEGVREERLRVLEQAKKEVKMLDNHFAVVIHSDGDWTGERDEEQAHLLKKEIFEEINRMLDGLVKK